jgi:hypothetical protein
MNLLELIDDNLTDKNTTHSYLGLYEMLLSDKKDTATHVLEIGLGDFKDKNGGSIKLWKNYFKNATVYGVDILGLDRVIDDLKHDPRVVLFTSTDGYDYHFFYKNILEKNIKFDFMLDDGPHTLDSMIKFIIIYSQVMADKGILVIEDVQDESWFTILYKVVPNDLKKYVRVYDLRKNKNRYDDLVFTIDKRIAN